MYLIKRNTTYAHKIGKSVLNRNVHGWLFKVGFIETGLHVHIIFLSYTNLATTVKKFLRTRPWAEMDFQKGRLFPTTYLPTYSMEQSPFWESNGFSASQKIPQNFHYRSYKCPPPVSILSQLDAVHTPISHVLKVHLKIIFQSTPSSSKWPLSLRFPHQNPLCISPLLSPIRATCPAQLIFLEQQ